VAPFFCFFSQAYVQEEQLDVEELHANRQAGQTRPVATILKKICAIWQNMKLILELPFPVSFMHEQES